MAKFQYNRFLEHSGKPKKPPLLSQRMEDNRISFRIDEVKELNDKLWLMGKDTPLKTGFKIKEEDKPTFSPLIPPTWSDREFTQWTNSFELDEIRRDFIFDIGDFDTDAGSDIDLELPPWFVIFYPNDSGSGQTGTQDKPDTVQTTTQIPEGTEVPLLGLTLNPIATQHTTPESPLVYTVTLLNFDGEAEPVDYDMLVPINISSDGAIDVDYELSNIIPASAFGIEQGDFYDVAAFAIIPKGETSVDIIVTPINPGKTEPVEITMAVMPIFAFTKDFNPIDNPEVGSPDGTSPIDNLIMPEVESTQTGYLTPSLLTADYQFIPSDQDTDLPLEDKIPQSEHCPGTSQTAPYLPDKGFYLGTIETTIIASANIEAYPSTTTSFTITPIDPDATQHWGLGDPVNMTVTDTDNAKVLTINVSGGVISDSHIVHRGSIPIVTSDPFTPTNLLITPAQWKDNDDNPSGKIDTTSAMPPYKPSSPGKNPTSLNGQKGAPNKYDFNSPPLWNYTVSFPNNAPPGAFIKPTVGADAIKANPYNPAVIQFPDKIGVDVPAQVWNNNNSNPLQVNPLACLNYRIQVFLELYSTYQDEDSVDDFIRIPEDHPDPLQVVIRAVLVGDVSDDYYSEEITLAVSLSGTATPDSDYFILGEGQTPIDGTNILADYQYSENVLGVRIPAGVLSVGLKEVTVQVPITILQDEEDESDESIEVTPFFPEEESESIVKWADYSMALAYIIGVGLPFQFLAMGVFAPPGIVTIVVKVENIDGLNIWTFDGDPLNYYYWGDNGIYKAKTLINETIITRFDVSHPSNLGYRLELSTRIDGVHDQYYNPSWHYIETTAHGVPGTDGAYIELIPPGTYNNSPPSYYSPFDFDTPQMAGTRNPAFGSVVPPKNFTVWGDGNTIAIPEPQHLIELFSEYGNYYSWFSPNFLNNKIQGSMVNITSDEFDYYRFYRYNIDWVSETVPKPTGGFDAVYNSTSWVYDSEPKLQADDRAVWDISWTTDSDITEEITNNTTTDENPGGGYIRYEVIEKREAYYDTLDGRQTGNLTITKKSQGAYTSTTGTLEGVITDYIPDRESYTLDGTTFTESWTRQGIVRKDGSTLTTESLVHYHAEKQEHIKPSFTYRDYPAFGLHGKSVLTHSLNSFGWSVYENGTPNPRWHTDGLVSWVEDNIDYTIRQYISDNYTFQPDTYIRQYTERFYDCDVEAKEIKTWEEHLGGEYIWSHYLAGEDCAYFYDEDYHYHGYQETTYQVPTLFPPSDPTYPNKWVRKFEHINRRYIDPTHRESLGLTRYRGVVVVGNKDYRIDDNNNFGFGDASPVNIKLNQETGLYSFVAEQGYFADYGFGRYNACIAQPFVTDTQQITTGYAWYNFSNGKWVACDDTPTTPKTKVDEMVTVPNNLPYNALSQAGQLICIWTRPFEIDGVRHYETRISRCTFKITGSTPSYITGNNLNLPGATIWAERLTGDVVETELLATVKNAAFSYSEVLIFEESNWLLPLDETVWNYINNTTQVYKVVDETGGETMEVLLVPQPLYKSWGNKLLFTGENVELCAVRLRFNTRNKKFELQEIMKGQLTSDGIETPTTDSYYSIVVKYPIEGA